MNANVEEFHRQFAAGDPTKIDWLADGISELDQYFSEQMLTNVDLYNQKKQEFETLVDPLSGRFYMWGIESDYSLVFISDVEYMELGEDSRHYKTEPEDEDKDEDEDAYDVGHGW